MEVFGDGSAGASGALWIQWLDEAHSKAASRRSATHHQKFLSPSTLPDFLLTLPQRRDASDRAAPYPYCGGARAGNLGVLRGAWRGRGRPLLERN